ncbi:MAG: thioesterase family protein [Actinomycetota bacterium]|nr:thioesterase family protein [Actinomycetota bacterium]
MTDDDHPIRAFLQMRPGRSADHWRLPVTEGLCGGRGNLYGGCGLAAVIEAAEGAVGKPTAWATCQFVGGAKPPDIIDLEVEVLATGHYMSQARVTGFVDGNLFLTALAALGRRPSIAEGTWEKMPIVPPPDQCSSRKLANEERRGGLRPRIDERTATIAPDGFMAADGEGNSALWATLPGGVPAYASALAIVGDDVSAGVNAVVLNDVRARSIDNTIRVVSPQACDWVLADIKIHAVTEGLGHGRVNLWSPSGHLLAVTEQSGLVGPR